LLFVFFTFFVLLFARSSPPKKNPAAMANTMTTMVNRAVSSRLGQTDFRSS